MSLRVIGAGVGRTGTTSLKAALETLLGGRCYHMFEVYETPADMPLWDQAMRGGPTDWDALLGNCVAAVDWPAAAFWEELAAAFPDALIVLSERDPEAWWASASNTIFRVLANADESRWLRTVAELLARTFTADIGNRDAAIAAYRAHNDYVRAHAPAERLLVWRADDGWAPLCAALGVAEPDTDFPHLNSGADFRARQVKARPAT